MIDTIASDKVLDESYAWLCERREQASHHSDVWTLRHDWSSVKHQVQRALLDGTYHFSPVKKFIIRGETISFWGSQDALVLKAMAIVLTEHLVPHLSNRCFHVKDHGGLKKAVEEVKTNLDTHPFFLRSDVKSYYASIDHDVLLKLCAQYISDPMILGLIEQYCHHLIDVDANLFPVEKGISLGCPLSPLMGALYLKPLDDAMADCNVHYTRYMDDWCLLADTRWHLKKAIRIMNRVLNDLKVVKHPDKTEIGRIENRTFTFLGYTFSQTQLGIAQPTLKNFNEHVVKLYEQGASKPRILQYVQRWLSWVQGGLSRYAKDIRQWLASLLLFAELPMDYFDSPALSLLLESFHQARAPFL